jgi:hypothetical protein
MLARLMRHPAGLVKKAWRITLHRADRPSSEPVEAVAPPILPHRFRGNGISVDTETALPRKDIAAAPQASGHITQHIGQHIMQHGHAASFLDPAAP